MDSRQIKLITMYYEIKRLRQDEHYSIQRIADYYGINFRTAKKYLSMNEKEFEEHLCTLDNRPYLLDPYKEFIVSYIKEHEDVPAAVMHDKLKEHFVNFPQTHPKTVYNYVMKIRHEYGFPKEKPLGRQYSPIPDTEPGALAQVDFGEKKLRNGSGDFVTVYFFAILLCFSRYKYVLFRDTPFTASSVTRAHEKAFDFFRGIPKEILYDQDCVFIHNENSGDYKMTEEFNRYQVSLPFKVTFCRKADPESKGKIESLVKFVKRNFLYNRQFTDIETLNKQTLEWLARTANKMIHNTTRKVPFLQWKHEKSFLLPWSPILNPSYGNQYKVLKTNVVKYKGNSYSLPFGSYRDQDTFVSLIEKEGNLQVRDDEKRLIATHMIPDGVGHNVINNNHRRNSSIKINDLREKVKTFFRDSSDIALFLDVIDRRYPRYVRDQLSVLLICSEKAGLPKAEITLDFCLKNKISSANDFKSILESSMEKRSPSSPKIKPLGNSTAQFLTHLEPEKSDINEYETLFLSNEKNNQSHEPIHPFN